MPLRTVDRIILFARVDKPFDKSWEHWIVRWWHWFFSIPKEINPANDESGRFCGINQNDPNVWFLAGTFSGSAQRTCTIPAGRAILFPVINCECSNVEYPELKTDSELTHRVRNDIDAVTDMEIIINGRRIVDLKNFRVSVAAFDMSFPSNNPFGLTAGVTRLASDGYWIFLKPPLLGNNEITFHAKAPNYETHIIYHLAIE